MSTIVMTGTKTWCLVYHSASNIKYAIKLVALVVDGYPSYFPVSVEETGKPGAEIYFATYANMTVSSYTSLAELAKEHNSYIDDFETLEDYN